MLKTETPKRGRGKPQYVPTEADRAVVKNMAAAGIVHEQIAECMDGGKGIDPKTLRLYFHRELATSRNSVTALAMSQVVKAMNAGEAWACCFWLKCRGGWRETQAHAFVDSAGKDRPFMLSDIDRIVSEADAADAKPAES